VSPGLAVSILRRDRSVSGKASYAHAEYRESMPALGFGRAYGTARGEGFRAPALACWATFMLSLRDTPRPALLKSSGTRGELCASMYLTPP
jgi:hypothetical protein